uniref:Uncharacterized protein n=1 Tax=Schistocephalus solidus TaxID=70667 RepID=A0A0X3PQN5_SCHSO
MASRVELKLTPLPELVDSPDIDPNTQRPRTPNTVPTDFPLIQRKNVRKIANTFFTCTEPCKYAGDFRRHRRTYMIPKEVLYMQDRRDVFWVGPEWSRKSEYQHDGAPPSAVLPWPREQAGLLIVFSIFERFRMLNMYVLQSNCYFATGTRILGIVL